MAKSSLPPQWRRARAGIAKQLASNYLPGKLSYAWQKIKPALTIPCLIRGYQPCREWVAGLLVAAKHAGQLKYVARLRSGFTEPSRVELGRLLGEHRRSSAAIACPTKAVLGRAEVLFARREPAAFTAAIARAPSHLFSNK